MSDFDFQVQDGVIHVNFPRQQPGGTASNQDDARGGGGAEIIRLQDYRAAQR